MSELKIKNGVKPRSLIIAAAMINAANEIKLEIDVVITSGNDGEHMNGSKHYSDNALDFRSKTYTNEQIGSLIKNVRRRLGKKYQIIVENEMKTNEHIHIEYDPL